MFADGTASGLFDACFPGHGKSEALSILFRINSIPGMRPPAEAPGPDGAPPAAAAGERDGVAAPAMERGVDVAGKPDLAE